MQDLYIEARRASVTPGEKTKQNMGDFPLPFGSKPRPLVPIIPTL